ncbi:hypothetical protein DY000_02022077 [Brassica cretica]|uniref:DUF1985 domain-containing protein n=1 Tax=Brassica cretica TaxID=69181 RepID=A0ABQ7E6K0_BRACR|nr:hypothetical protein DY000_02022077 [Brassica cretica]
MAIISGFVSKYHFWKEQFFFVRVSDTSVEASAIPVFRTGWGRRGILDYERLLCLVLKMFDPYTLDFRFTVSNNFYRVPEGFLTVRELLRRCPCFWANFTPKRVRCAVLLHHSRFQPDLPIEEGLESSMDGFIPYVPRTKRDRSKPCKDKHPMVDEDAVDGQLSPDNILKDYLDIQFNLDGLLEFDFPPTEGGSGEVPEFSKAARMVNGVGSHL